MGEGPIAVELLKNCEEATRNARSVDKNRCFLCSEERIRKGGEARKSRSSKEEGGILMGADTGQSRILGQDWKG